MKVATELRLAGGEAQPTVCTNCDRDIGKLMGEVMDKFGRHSIGLGRAGMTTAPDWSMKRSALSPRYATEWDQLLVVKPA